MGPVDGKSFCKQTIALRLSGYLDFKEEIIELVTYLGKEMCVCIAYLAYSKMSLQVSR